MDELTLEGKKYLSSKRAAKITGYAKDYIGQLCREGRVTARLVGRGWYVLEDSIREHRFGNDDSVNNKTDVLINGNQDLIHAEEQKAQKIRYTAETTVPIQTIVHKHSFISSEIDHLKQQEQSIQYEMRGVSSMQDMWHEWFYATPSKEELPTNKSSTSIEKENQHTGKANDFNENLINEDRDAQQVQVSKILNRPNEGGVIHNGEWQEFINHAPLLGRKASRLEHSAHTKNTYTAIQKPLSTPVGTQHAAYELKISAVSTRISNKFINLALMCLAVLIVSYAAISVLSASQKQVHTGPLWYSVNYIGGVRAFVNK